MTRQKMLVAVLLLMLALFALPAAAQDATEAPEGEAPPMELPPLPGEPLVTGLNHPRNFAWGEDGTLYIAEVGLGGEIQIDTPEGPGTFGMSSQLTVVPADGEQFVAFGNMPSAGDAGAHSVIPTADAIYVLIGGAAPNIPMSSAVLVLHPENYRMIDYVDVWSFEAQNNPDGNEIDTNIVDGMLADDGSLWIVDAGGNGILRWTAEGGLESVITWPDNQVPTGIDVGPDGNIYVSFLSQAPFIPGTAKIEVLSPTWEPVETLTGLTMATDVLVTDDGTVYAVQLSTGLGEGGFQPGSVVTVSADGVTPVLEDVLFPYSIDETPDGRLAVSVVSAFIPAPGAGAIVLLP